MPTNLRFWKHMAILRFLRNRQDDGERTTTRHLTKFCRDQKMYVRSAGTRSAIAKLRGAGSIRFDYVHVYKPFYEVAPAMTHNGDLRVWMITETGRRLLEKVDEQARAG